MKNKNLKQFYNNVYIKGERAHYSKLLFGAKITEEKFMILKAVSWKGKRVLDIGCGTGELAFYMAQKGAKSVVGIDYSYSAIHLATQTYKHEALKFFCDDFSNVIGTFDVITMVGVLEHVDEPFKIIEKAKKLLSPKGSIIIVCPNWSNPRGYVLQTLFYLFGARITLVDLHYFTPIHFINWADRLKMKLKWKTIEHSWGHGTKMIKDFKKRLPSILKDLPGAKKGKDLNLFINWLETKVLPLEGDSRKHTGATGFYHLTK